MFKLNIRFKLLFDLLRYHYEVIFFRFLDNVESFFFDFFIIVKKFRKVFYLIILIFSYYLFSYYSFIYFVVVIILYSYLPWGFLIDNFPVWMPIKFIYLHLQINKEFLFIKNLWIQKKKLKVIKLY